jgi:hypothetical protein
MDLNDLELGEVLMAKENAAGTKKRQDLIAAMLRPQTLQKAAEAAGISEATAWRIRQTPEFQKEYMAARNAAYDHSLGLIQNAATKAATLLVIAINDSQVSMATRVQAAHLVLEHSRDAALRDDLERRVVDLELGRQE